MSEIIAKSRYVKSAPRKLRAVAVLVKNKTATSSMVVLQHTTKKAAGILSKTIKTAIYNAVNNFNLDKEKLVIKTIMIDQGPTMKRFRAQSRGGASTYKKRTSHITVILETSEEKSAPKKKPVVKKEVAKDKDTETKPETKKETKKTTAKTKTVKPKGSKTEVKVQTRKEKKEEAKK